MLIGIYKFYNKNKNEIFLLNIYVGIHYSDVIGYPGFFNIRYPDKIYPDITLFLFR